MMEEVEIYGIEASLDNTSRIERSGPNKYLPYILFELSASLLYFCL